MLVVDIRDSYGDLLLGRLTEGETWAWLMGHEYGSNTHFSAVCYVGVEWRIPSPGVLPVSLQYLHP